MNSLLNIIMSLAVLVFASLLFYGFGRWYFRFDNDEDRLER